jgi:hypothetical protein
VRIPLSLWTLQGSDGAGMNLLYGLYSSILLTQIVRRNAKSQRMVEVLLTMALYLSLCDGAIAELAGARTNLVKKWMVDLGSFLYRDEGANDDISFDSQPLSQRVLPPRLSSQPQDDG